MDNRQWTMDKGVELQELIQLLPKEFKFYYSEALPVMAKFDSLEFDLAIVDVPYGIGQAGASNKTRCKLAKSKNYIDYFGGDKEAPNAEYWNELRRVSKHQIVWGANHFISRIPIDSSCWIVWDKDNGETDFADCELAWTSFKTACRKFKWRWQGMLQENMSRKQVRIHPNEKPVELYEWILKEYAQPGYKILDTHVGSASIALAIDNLNKIEGMDLTLVAIDADAHYLYLAIKRLLAKVNQLMIGM